MISFVQWAQRNWRSFRPVELPKQSDALRLGLLGASKIAYVVTHFAETGERTIQHG